MGMRKQIILIGAGAVAVLVVSAACNKVDAGREDPAGHITSATATASATTPTAGAEAHNNADVWFVRQMIPHHQQAIEMSDIVLPKHGIDPRVTELASTIKAAQDAADPADAGLDQPMGQSIHTDDGPRATCKCLHMAACRARCLSGN